MLYKRINSNNSKYLKLSVILINSKNNNFILENNQAKYIETKNWKSFFSFLIYKWQIKLTLFQTGEQQFLG